MLIPQSPFKGGAEEEIFEAILESEIHFPSRLHPTARNLLEKVRTLNRFARPWMARFPFSPLALAFSPLALAFSPPVPCAFSQLLERDPAKRLGGGPRDSLDVKEHPYFQGIDWAALLRKEVEITYRPQLVRSPPRRCM